MGCAGKDCEVEWMMERITFNGNFCDIAQCREMPCQHGGNCSQKQVWERLKAYEDTGLTPGEVKSMQEEHFSGLEMAKLYSVLMELKKYQEADKDGRIVVLPCKVGQRVFALLDTDKHISECEVKQIGMGNEIGFIGLEPICARGREYGVALNGFGKTVFLTREEAEKVLEAMKDE